MDLKSSLDFDVPGDCSYLGLLDVQRYKSFVGDNWDENERLLEPHFLSQIQAHAALIWDTGFEGEYRVTVKSGWSAVKGFRETSGGLLLSAGEAYLVNYDSLTMAAQFDDHVLPDDDCRSQCIRLSPGTYAVRVVQMFDPDLGPQTAGAAAGGPAADFLVEFESRQELPKPWSVVPWSRL